MKTHVMWGQLLNENYYDIREQQIQKSQKFTTEEHLALKKKE